MRQVVGGAGQDFNFIFFRKIDRPATYSGRTEKRYHAAAVFTDDNSLDMGSRHGKHFGQGDAEPDGIIQIVAEKAAALFFEQDK